MQPRKTKTVIRRSGVYLIRNLSNDRVYVGSASDILKRWSVHKCLLRKGIHHCTYLQRAWNKYSESSFEFVILCRCRIDRLKLLEQVFMDKYELKYNIHPTSNYAYGFTFSKRTKKKMSISAIKFSNTKSQKLQRSKRCKRQWLIGNIGRRKYVIRPRVCIKCGIDWIPERLDSGNLSQSDYCKKCRPIHKGGYYKYQRASSGEGRPKQLYPGV